MTISLFPYQPKAEFHIPVLFQRQIAPLILPRCPSTWGMEPRLHQHSLNEGHPMPELLLGIALLLLHQRDMHSYFHCSLKAYKTNWPLWYSVDVLKTWTCYGCYPGLLTLVLFQCLVTFGFMPCSPSEIHTAGFTEITVFVYIKPVFVYTDCFIRPRMFFTPAISVLC